jgi:tetratricopeptide (TPR) repeat protein
MAIQLKLFCFLFVGMLAAQPTPAPTAAAHTGKAVQLMQNRSFAEAAAEFELALASSPDNDDLRIQYATCLFAQERDQEARKQFEIERGKLGDQAGLMYFLGRIDVRAEEYTAALSKLKPLASNPAFPKASFYLGLAYQATGQAALALAALEKAARDNAGDPEVHYRLGRVYSGTGRTDDAERQYKLYRELHDSQQAAERDGGACMDALRAQPIAQARVVCQRLADPKDGRRLIFLGQVYAQAGAFAEAVEPLRAGAQLESASFEAWQYLGLSLFALKRYEEAVTPLRKAAALNPQYFDTLNMLAKDLHILGRDKEALPVLEQAHQLNPGDAVLEAVLQQMRAALRK